MVLATALGEHVKWVKSEIAPNVCTLLVNDADAVCIGMVEYDKHAPSNRRWAAVEMLHQEVVGRAQTKIGAQGLLLTYLRLAVKKTKTEVSGE